MKVGVGKDLEDDLVHGNAEHVADEAEKQVMNLAQSALKIIEEGRHEVGH